MKRLMKIVTAVVMLVVLTVIPSVPVGANDSNIYESFLSDNTAPACPDILNYGKVIIDSDFVAQIEILTNATDKTYSVAMEVGGSNHRYAVNLGTITTNSKGRGEAYFDLKDYDSYITTPHIISPHFMIKTPEKPFIEFDTSYLVFPDASPPEPGRVILMAGAPDFNDAHFSLDMSYGYDVGYPCGVSLKEGEEVGSLFTLIPGLYTITQRYQSGWNFPKIIIDDPTGDSRRTGRFTAIVNVAPGETVTVRFVNTASDS